LDHLPIKILSLLLDVLLYLGVFLIQALATLLRDRKLRTVRRVVTSEDVDGCVEGAKRLFSRHVGETPVKAHEVNHLLLHVLVDRVHIRGPFIHLCCVLHVLHDRRGIVVIVLAFDTPFTRDRKITV